MNQNFVNELYKIAGETNIRSQESMAKHTTFRIGGPVPFFVTPETVEELGQLVLLCKAEKVPFFIMGHGSNLLVGDDGMDGIVIQLCDKFAHLEITGRRVTAQAGVMLSKLGQVLKEAQLTGFEFAAGIPGTLGGAVVMNAGAYGGEIKDVIELVQLMDSDGNLLQKTGEEMQFSYRHSIVEEQGYIVLGATLVLEQGEKRQIEARMEELAQARRSKQPLEFPSAGSTFKRPEGYYAGKLIMDAGLRGYQVGGAQVAEKHCGFVINRGDATAADVAQLMSEVCTRVYEQFKVELEPEVKLVGKPKLSISGRKAEEKA
ncbi:MAG: UDP-N-acetylmuramate dehydrogenase [Lachnospiraceae bacterium]|nr:UDP-N-acetylmuramate dehydrogenase [Lachnospiraceae bacterium]